LRLSFRLRCLNEAARAADSTLEAPGADVWEPALHHSNDFEIPSRTLQGLRSSRNLEYYLRRNKLRGLFLTGGVDELHETVHDALIRFDGHADHLSKLSTSSAAGS
jgi:hypothetical protein